MSKIWDRVQATALVRIDTLSPEERERRREKRKRKSRIQRRKMREAEERAERSQRRVTKIGLEVAQLDGEYLAAIAAPLPIVELPASPGEHKQSDEVYIYGIADPRDHVVRYVGKTHRSLRDRLYEHEFKPSNQAVCEWLKALRASEIKAEMVVLEVCKNHQWQSREIHWIARMRKERMLLNIAKGGKFYGPPKGKPAAMASQAFHRRAIARSGPVKHLSREEIAAIYGTR